MRLEASERGCRRSEFPSPRRSQLPAYPRTERTYCKHGSDDEATHTSRWQLRRRWRWLALAGGRLRLGSSGGDYGGQHPDYETRPGRLAGAAGGAAQAGRRAAARRHRRLSKSGSRRCRATRSSPTSGPPGAGPAASSSRPCRSSRPATASEVAFLGDQLARTPTTPPRPSSKRRRCPTRATPTPTARSPTRWGDPRRLPDTAFYDAAGKLVYLKQGPYADGSELEADLRRYALGS